MNRQRALPWLVSIATCCLLALQPGVARGSCLCPPGTTYDAAADRCQAAFEACLAGYAYSTSSNQCEVSAVATTSSATCPAGSSFNPLFGKCEAANLSPCPSGYTYNASTLECEIPATFAPAASCPDGYAFDSASARCVGPSNSACAQGGWWGYYEQTCCSGSPLPGFGWDDETGQYCGPWACPPGYSVNRWTGSCSGPMVTASCPAGSVINSYTSKCEAAAGAACAAGQTYNGYNAKCDFAPLVSADPSACPPGYILDVDTQVCAGAVNSACPAGSGYGHYEQACCSGDPLPGFGWDDETNQYCGGWSCPPGFALDPNLGSCSGAPCPAGQVYDTATSACKTPAPATASTLLCAAGSRFNPLFGKCEAANLSPCPSGYAYDASTNKCEIPATFTPAASCPDGYTYDALECVGPPSSACAQSGGQWGYYEQACTSGSPLPGFGWDDETGQYCGPWSCPPVTTIGGLLKPNVSLTGGCILATAVPEGRTGDSWPGSSPNTAKISSDQFSFFRLYN